MGSSLTMERSSDAPRPADGAIVKCCGLVGDDHAAYFWSFALNLGAVHKGRPSANECDQVGSVACASRMFPVLDALQLVKRDFVRVPLVGAACSGGLSYIRARHIATVITRLGQTL
jgi:hypothetical protein